MLQPVAAQVVVDGHRGLVVHLARRDLQHLGALHEPQAAGSQYQRPALLLLLFQFADGCADVALRLEGLPATETGRFCIPRP